jgi:hypothetical protein
MNSLKIEILNNIVAERIKPFFEEILTEYKENIHSLHIVGSSLTEDFDEKTSDINSVIVLKEMEFKFVELVAPLGKKYIKKRVAAPLIMTPEYIKRSLDVFPIEFLNFKLIHETVYGDDIFKDIEINKDDLRIQCEREIKIRLIGLRQSYISSMGDRQFLTDYIVGTISGYIPLFRGILYLLGRKPPVRRHDVIINLLDSTGIKTGIFEEILNIKKNKTKLSKEDIERIFEEYYKVTEELGNIIDELKI